ncbi:hypothetical protein TNCV_3425651 [Trichonephila clavipes]|nr:hypothetical protein TNCV_3425651 [Trichonephila clavipes]
MGIRKRRRPWLRWADSVEWDNKRENLENKGVYASTTEDPPRRGAMHFKSVESSNVLPSIWCGSLERGASSGVVLVK